MFATLLDIWLCFVVAAFIIPLFHPAFTGASQCVDAPQTEEDKRWAERCSWKWRS